LAVLVAWPTIIAPTRGGVMEQRYQAVLTVIAVVP
jgi:hypothetical protein